jgi:hypothetical protein
MFSISWFIAIACQAGLVILLTRRLGAGTGLATHFLLMIAFSGVGWLLLKQLATDQITWRNNAVAILMPWPAILGGGSIPAYVLKNTMAAIVFAALVATVDRLGVFSVHTAPPNNNSPSLSSHLLACATVVCWIVLAAAWAWTLRSALVNQPDTVSALLSLRGVAIPLLLPPVMVTASLLLRYTGHAVASLLVVAVPLILILLPVMMMLAVIVFHSITGKPMRWN